MFKPSCSVVGFFSVSEKPAVSIFGEVGVTQSVYRRAARAGFDSRQCKDFFYSLQRPDRLWCPPSLLSNGHRRLFLRVKPQGREADHYPHPVPRSRMAEIYLHSPPCLHGRVLNWLRTETSSALLHFYFRLCTAHLMTQLGISNYVASNVWWLMND
jgi:hypothetical protein